jgi:hypothetical protein
MLARAEAHEAWMSESRTAYLRSLNRIIIHLDMIYLPTSRLILLKHFHRQASNFRRHGHIIRVSDPEVTVDILCTHVRDEFFPGLLLVVEDLLGLFIAERCGVLCETAPLIRLAVLVNVSLNGRRKMWIWMLTPALRPVAPEQNSLASRTTMLFSGKASRCAFATSVPVSCDERLASLLGRTQQYRGAELVGRFDHP